MQSEKACGVRAATRTPRVRRHVGDASRHGGDNVLGGQRLLEDRGSRHDFRCVGSIVRVLASDNEHGGAEGTLLLCQPLMKHFRRFTDFILRRRGSDDGGHLLFLRLTKCAGVATVLGSFPHVQDLEGWCQCRDLLLDFGIDVRPYQTLHILAFPILDCKQKYLACLRDTCTDVPRIGAEVGTKVAVVPSLFVSFVCCIVDLRQTEVVQGTLPPRLKQLARQGIPGKELHAAFRLCWLRWLFRGGCSEKAERGVGHVESKHKVGGFTAMLLKPTAGVLTNSRDHVVSCMDLQRRSKHAWADAMGNCRMLLSIGKPAFFVPYA